MYERRKLFFKKVVGNTRFTHYQYDRYDTCNILGDRFIIVDNDSYGRVLYKSAEHLNNTYLYCILMNTDNNLTVGIIDDKYFYYDIDNDMEGDAFIEFLNDNYWNINPEVVSEQLIAVNVYGKQIRNYYITKGKEAISIFIEDDNIMDEYNFLGVIIDDNKRIIFGALDTKHNKLFAFFIDANELDVKSLSIPFYIRKSGMIAIERTYYHLLYQHSGVYPT